MNTVIGVSNCSDPITQTGSIFCKNKTWQRKKNRNKKTKFSEKMPKSEDYI